jgi:hypothetical protein
LIEERPGVIRVFSRLVRAPCKAFLLQPAAIFEGQSPSLLDFATVANARNANTA